MKLLKLTSLVSLALLIAACVQNELIPVPIAGYRHAMARHHFNSKAQASTPNPTLLASNENSSERIGNLRMDSSDRSRLSHALDNPLGKSTTWKSKSSDIIYTVTPKRKITVNGNPFCREYIMIENRGGREREVNGIACVDTTSSKWHGVS